MSFCSGSRVRHLEGHDQMREVKLGLQVQLDGNVLHACKQKNVR